MDVQGVKGIIKQCRGGYDAMITKQLVPKLEEAGFQVVVPDEHTLQVDIDDEDGYKVYKRAITYVKRQFNIVEIKKAPSISGYPKRHITLRMVTPLPVITRTYLQMILGSDFKREILSLRRIKNNYDMPLIFIERGWLEVDE